MQAKLSGTMSGDMQSQESLRIQSDHRHTVYIDRV
jgi:hypothetical protein